jgi:alkaline phosphatase D
MLDTFLAQPWDVAVMLGDNIYADTTNANVMQAKYADRKDSSFWKELSSRPLLATWDDHDFGWNDSGADYPMKREAQRLFRDFVDAPPDSELRGREGIYHVKMFGPPGQRLQIILLDTRYFRGTLSTGIHNAVPSGGNYVPSPDTNKTLLGEAQWRWLENQLKVPADVRIVVSSIQFISEFSGAEAWANLPHEKRRMLDLVERCERAFGGEILFISGDRHWAELSRLDRPDLPPLYDLTSSALTQKHARGTPTPNRFRDGPTYHDANMGLILIDWKSDVRSPAITLRLLDADGRSRIEKNVRPQVQKAQ